MYLQTNNVIEIATQIAQLAHPPNALAVILVGEKTTLDIPQLIAALNERNVNFIGGIFPGVIVGSQRYEAGLAVEVLPALTKPIVIQGLNQNDFKLDAIEAAAQTLPHVAVKPTALVLVDGLTTNIALLLTRLFGRLQNRVTYIGGGAGSLSLKQQPCIFSSAGLYQDAAVIAFLNLSSTIGVRHGWRNLRGPFVASRTNRNIVLELDYQPAFKIYSEIIHSVTDKTLTKENFFAIAKGFPLGLFHKGVDRIVRDPITFTSEGGLICVGEVPEASLIYILYGDPQRLIDHAKKATKEALGHQKHVDQCFVVDCISRVLYLEDRFKDELNGVSAALPRGSHEPIGMLSLGEIGSYATGSVEFFNKTIVVSMMNQITPTSDPSTASSPPISLAT